MSDLSDRFGELDRIVLPDLDEELRRPRLSPGRVGRRGGRIVSSVMALVLGSAAVGLATWAFRTGQEPTPTPTAMVANGAIAFTSGVDGYHIATVTPDGVVADLTRPTGDAYDLGAVWSPDGSRIGFLRYTITDRENGTGDYELFVAESDGSGLVDFDQSAVSFSWSPDGSAIAYSSFQKGSDYDIFVAGADGSGRRAIVDGPLTDVEPSWSPTGDAVAFVSHPVLDRDAGDADIYVVRPDGTGLSRLTGSPEWDYEPVWSPDGTRIAYLTEHADEREIYVMNADGSRKIAVTDAPTNDVVDPVWSPDGTRMVFQVHSGTSWDIYVVNADGTGQVALADGLVDEVGPTWSPDGSLIAYSAAESSDSCECDNSGSFDIYVVKPDGTDTTRLTTEAQELGGDLSWQPSFPAVTSPTLAPTPTDAPAETRPLNSQVTATIPVGAFPRGVAVADGVVWITVDKADVGLDDHVLVKIDPVTNQITATTPVFEAGDVAVGHGSVWVTSRLDNAEGAVLRIDPSDGHVIASITVGLNTSDVAVDDQAVWATTNTTTSGFNTWGEVVRIDPATNEIVDHIVIDGGWPRDIVVGEGSIWVYGHSKLGTDGWEASSLWRIDPQTNELVARVLDQTGFLGDGGFLPDNVAVGGGWLWAASDRGKGLRIDPATGMLTTFELPEGGFAWPFLAYEGNVFFGREPVGILEMETLEVVGSIALESEVADAALDPVTGTLWIANYEGTVTRIDLP